MGITCLKKTEIYVYNLDTSSPYIRIVGPHVNHTINKGGPSTHLSVLHEILGFFFPLTLKFSLCYGDLHEIC